MAVLNSAVALLVALAAWHSSNFVPIHSARTQRQAESTNGLSGAIYCDPLPADCFADQKRNQRGGNVDRHS